MVKRKSRPPCLFPKTRADRRRHAEESWIPLLSEIALQLSIVEAKTSPEPECKAFFELCRQNDLSSYRDGLREIQELIDDYRDPDPIVADLFMSQGFPGCYVVSPENLIWKIPAFSDSGIYIDQDYVKEQIKLRVSEKTVTDDIWGNQEAVDWSSSPESAILVVSGSSQSLERLEKFSVEVVDHFASSDYTTLHLLSPLPTEVYERSTIKGNDAVRQLAIQSLRQNCHSPEASYTNIVLAEVMRGFKAANMEEWFDCLAPILAHHSRVAIVIDVRILRDSFRDADQWPAGFSKVIQELKGKTLVKVMVIDGRTTNTQLDSTIRTMTVDGA
ncbi:hypothetical protein FSARC_225 [Fusarium sarcochroum]|uniref:Uncharacterized protein n=1 Tax=Fusarium sarcochroum TaxID=1208366 RepID=A0A8H4UBQ6_9HYPO|nr:hypothetical protein FSARC_225 [Fusarium sarcochroum]